MIGYPSSLQAVGGARTGIAPVNLLDVQDVNGNLYRWADRKIVAPYAIGSPLSSAPPAGIVNPVAPSAGQHILWLLPTAFVPVQGTHVVASGDLTRGQLVLDYSWTPAVAGSITWSGWSVPALPPGATIDAAYACGIASQDASSPSFSNPLTLSGAQSSVSIDPTTIASQIVTAWLNATVPIGPYGPVTLTIASPCIAVYYSLAGGIPFDDAPHGYGTYEPWLLTVPQLTFHRSSVTDVGNFEVQNLSGDTLSRDMEKIMRASALEGSFFVYRSWQPDARAAWIEVHGKLTVDDVGVDRVVLKGAPAIQPAEEDAPALEYCETCQWRWSSAQCGATGPTECQYSYQTCQVPERILVVLNNYEKNFGETTANIPTQVQNRRRRF